MINRLFCELRRLWWLACDTLDNWLPAPCATCARWLRAGRLVAARHKIAGIVRVCPECHKALYGGQP